MSYSVSRRAHRMGAAATLIPSRADIVAAYGAFGVPPQNVAQSTPDDWARSFAAGVKWPEFIQNLANAYGAPTGVVPADPTQGSSNGAAAGGWSVSTLAIVGALAWFLLKRH